MELCKLELNPGIIPVKFKTRISQKIYFVRDLFLSRNLSLSFGIKCKHMIKLFKLTYVGVLLKVVEVISSVYLALFLIIFKKNNIYVLVVW